MDTLNEKKPRYSIWIFIILFAAALTVSMLVPYAYCNQFNLYKYSDFWVHNIYAQGLRARDFSDILGNYSAYQIILTYPLYHLCVAAICVFTGSIGSACVIFLSLCNAATVLLVRYCARRLAPPESALSAYFIDVTAALSPLIFCISSPLLSGGVLYPQTSPNFYHNPTILTVRPIAIAAFYFFVKTLGDIRNGADEKKRRRDTLLFAALLALSVLAKPSFALVFLFGAGVTVLIKVLRDFRREWKRTGLVMLLAVLPTLALMAVQYYFVSLAPSYNLFSGLAPLSSIFTLENLKYTLSVLAIPIVYFAFGGRKLFVRSDAYTCAGLQLLFAWFIWFCTGSGWYSLTNHSWGYSLAAFFMIVISMLCAARYSRSVWLKLSMLAVYFVQAYYGVAYILHVWQDGLFSYSA